MSEKQKPPSSPETAEQDQMFGFGDVAIQEVYREGERVPDMDRRVVVVELSDGGGTGSVNAGVLGSRDGHETLWPIGTMEGLKRVEDEEPWTPERAARALVIGADERYAEAMDEKFLASITETFKKHAQKPKVIVPSVPRSLSETPIPQEAARNMDQEG